MSPGLIAPDARSLEGPDAVDKPGAQYWGASAAPCALVPRMPDPLDDLSARLRDRLVHEAAGAETVDEPDFDTQIRELVDREAGMLGAASRAELVRRVS